MWLGVQRQEQEPGCEWVSGLLLSRDPVWLVRSLLFQFTSLQAIVSFVSRWLLCLCLVVSPIIVRCNNKKKIALKPEHRLAALTALVTMYPSLSARPPLGTCIYTDNVY